MFFWAKSYPHFSSKIKHIQLRKKSKPKNPPLEKEKKHASKKRQQRSIRAWDFKGRTKNILLLAHIGYKKKQEDDF